MNWFISENYQTYKVVFWEDEIESPTVIVDFCDAISPRIAVQIFLSNNFDLWEMLIDFVENIPYTYQEAQQYFDDTGFMISVIEVKNKDGN